REPRLTKPKFLVFALLAPLALASASMNVAFVTELDFGVVATCCSASTDSGHGSVVSSHHATPVVFPVHLGAIAAAALGALAATLRPSRAAASAAGALALVGVAAAVPAVIHHVAPHVYETPSHRCPFCLLHFPEAALGIPLYAAMAVALFGGTSLLVRAADPRWREATDETRTLARRASLRTFIALVALAALMIAPVARYHSATGGASLFGAGP